ncbi:hypothetical protein CRG98_026491 [Punica granatum]|uniref:Plastocyanin-like domain-containing protein n=1 Tax=Punica granatum TaxID=22663 RepID=A0A2I0JA54_PUNGR|nr:hypothetical protein CRG98_026491 [Punica granatum]
MGKESVASWYKDDDINEVVAVDLATGQKPSWSDTYTINGQPGDFCNCSRVSGNEVQFDNANGSSAEFVLAPSLNNMSWPNPSTDVLMAYYRFPSNTILTSLYMSLIEFPIYLIHLRCFIARTLVGIILIIFWIGHWPSTTSRRMTLRRIPQGINVLDASADHPMHLHGYSFYVVGSGYRNFNNETDPKDYNLVDPPEVNTFSVPKNGWIAITFRANNFVKKGGKLETSIKDPLLICLLVVRLFDFEKEKAPSRVSDQY